MALLNADGVVSLRTASPTWRWVRRSLRGLATDQLGHARPQPAGSRRPRGRRLNQTLSTHPSANNDVLTGTRRNTISGRPVPTGSSAWPATTR